LKINEDLGGKDPHSRVALFREEQYELETEAYRGRPIRSDYCSGSDWNSVSRMAEEGNTRAKSSSTTCSGLRDNRLESSPYRLFHTFLGRAVLKGEVGAALPTTTAEKECNAATK
jgi:hypothetical protein